MKSFRYFRFVFAGLLMAGLCVFLSQHWLAVQAAPGAVFTVNNAGDAGDLAPGNGSCATAGGVCTLRAAIEEANALAGHDTITIGAYTILPATSLPTLSDDAGVTIKGNNVSTFIDGSNVVNVGLNIESDNNIIQGLLVWNFTSYGIRVWWSDNNLIGTDGDGVSDSAERNIILRNGTGIFLMGGVNRVAGNYLGVFGPGTIASANGTGIYVEGALDANCGTVIGTNGDGTGDAAEGNLISGNTGSGIYIHNSCVSVAGNIIGLNALGTAALPNQRGILVDEYTPGTRIGTNGDGISDDLERNIISGNTFSGIEVSAGASQVSIAGNTIGLNKAGNAALGNEYGIYVDNSGPITIGSNDDGLGDDREGNVVSGNTNTGILLNGANTTQNVAAGNKIGTDITGYAAIPNDFGIVLAGGAHHNLIGNDGDEQGTTEERNLIAGNAVGVQISGAASSHNTVAGNFIGTNDDASGALANTSSGIHIFGAPQNMIGGQVGNLISGNQVGIFIDQPTAISNTVSFNNIGINPQADAAIPNLIGIQIAAPNNLIGRQGDTTVLEGNTISGNTQYGVFIFGVNSRGNVIAGNYIGTSGDGLAAIPNGTGVFVQSAPANLFGTNGDGVGDQRERNLISGNTNYGIHITTASADGNIIAGNTIGLNASGNAALKNGSDDWGGGIYIHDAPNTLIGSDGDGVADAAERNVISGNNTNAIYIYGDGAYHTVVAGNYIGTTPDGLTAIPNGSGAQDGAVMIYNADGTRIGTDGNGAADAAERNVIAGNLGWGIRVFDGGSDTEIMGNWIGVNAAGNALGNHKSGIFLDEVYGVKVGGTQPALQNVIANNNGSGIAIGADASSTREINNVLRGNALYDNTGLGIDLGSDGVTANDPNDADSGPNALQNYPILSAATSASATTTITGTLNSKPNASFWIDFYANPACDISGCGEGKIYLGSHTITTDASGNASFVAALPVAVQDGAAITATATGSNKGETSEFSACVTAIVTEYRIYLPLVIR